MTPHRHHPLMAMRNASWQALGLLTAALAIAAVWTAVAWR